MKPARLEFAPLTKSEMSLCLDLLRWPSGKGWPAKFIQHVERVRIEGTATMALNVQRLVSHDERRALHGDTGKITHLASQRRDAENSQSLMRAQQKWRDRVICNDMTVQEQLRKTRNRQTFDFDAYVLAKLGRGLESDMPHFRIQAERKVVTRSGKPKSSRKTVFTASAVPIIENLGNLFDWLFVRATPNFQLSRFAHCCVCDAWEMKRMGGKRSTAVAEHIAGKGAETLAKERLARRGLAEIDTLIQATTDVKDVAKLRKRRSLAQAKVAQAQKDCPAWVYQLPLWPAVCHRPKCKDAFQHTVHNKTPKRILTFKGLMGSPNSSQKITVADSRTAKNKKQSSDKAAGLNLSSPW